MKLAGANTEEHSNIRLCLGRLAFELSNVADVLKFCLGLAHIFTSFTTKSSENVTGLLLPADLDEPTWGFGEEPADGEEQKQRGDLESDWEPPGELSGSAFVEIAATKAKSVKNLDIDRRFGINGCTYYSIQ